MNELKIYSSEMPKSFKTEYIKENSYTSLHLNKEIELVYLFCDNWKIHYGNSFINGEKECLFIINSNTLHSIYAKEYIKISIQPDFFPQCNLSDISFKNHITRDEYLKCFFSILKTSCQINPDNNSLLIKAQFIKYFPIY